MKEMHFHEGISHFSNIETPALIIGGDRDKLVPNQKIPKQQQQLNLDPS